MAEKILFTVERHGIKAEIIEHAGDPRPVRLVRVSGIEGGLSEVPHITLTPDQGDIISSLSSIARASSVAIDRLRNAGEEKHLEAGR